MNLMSNEPADCLERQFEVEGVQGTIRIVIHPSGKAMIVDIQALQLMTPAFIEAALYDVAAHIARQHAYVETMAKIKRDTWT